MEAITPSVLATDLLNGTKCDGIELTKNLFKDHKMSIESSKKQKLETYLRIRSLPNFDPKDRNDCYQVIDSNTLLVIPPKGSNANKFNSENNEKKRFNFSKIFDERADQSIVYDNTALPIVKRFLSGQNGLLFTYGITSSGKSYTTRGSTTNPGIIPRALKTLFEVINTKIVREVPQLKPNTFTECSMLLPEERKLEEVIRSFIFSQTDGSFELKLKMDSFRSQMSVINENSDESLVWDDILHSTFRANESNIRCSVWISFYEIYNETIYDLLELDVSGEKKPKILLLKDEANNYYVKGLRQIFVNSPEEAYKVLLFGQNNLHISSTNLNKNSSRSHSAFTITLVSTFSSSYTNRSALNINHLSICDLAGAERSEKANNTGDRIREAGKINGSLLSLSRLISTLRHNQKFEHDASKQRYVNYRDSKLTKVFQPFLSGNGMAAMISTMNPSPNLFDETFFALKFTGVASQVVVGSEYQKNKLHDSLKRLTQMWMQSSQRWSNFASLKPPKPSVSIIQEIKEEEEDESEGESLDMTIDQMEKRVNEITQMDLSRADPQEIEVLRTQIEFLMEKLKQSESDKFEMEVEVRKQVVSEFNKLFKDMEEMADNKDRAKRELENMMTKRLINAENLHKQEKLELENKINSMETENFKINEEMCQLREDRDKAITYSQQILEEKALIMEQNNKIIEEMNQIIEQKEKIIKELKTQLSKFSDTKSETKNFRDGFTSPFKTEIRDNSTSPPPLNLIDANNSALNLFESRDANTSAIDLTEHLISVDNQMTDTGIGTSFIELKDCETSTTNLNQMIDKNISVFIESSDKSTITQNYSFEDKQTETESLSYSPSDNSLTLVDKSVSMLTIEYNSVSMSPIPSLNKSNENDLIVRQELIELKEKLQKYENEMKEKEAMIRYHQKSELESIKKIKDLEEENNKLSDKLKTKDDFDFGLKNFGLKQKTLAVSSNTTSSVSSFGSKGEDTISTTSVDSFIEKPKKTAKYSSRKRKQNINNSSDKRYLSSLNDESETTIDENNKCSQTSVNCGEFADEVGNEIFSIKKKSNRKMKRKPNTSLENEDNNSNRGPHSKRKRPPLTAISSPISPIPTGERITRSRARKGIDFSNY